MAFNQERLLDALRELEDPATFWMIYSHVATIEPNNPPSDPNGLLREVRTVLDIAVGQDIVEKRDNVYSLAPRSEVDENPKHDENGLQHEAVEYETSNVASLVSSEDDELIKPYLTELFKLACEDKKSHAHKCGGKRKRETSAESDNKAVISGTKSRDKKEGMSSSEVGKNLKVDEEGVEREAVECETGHVTDTVSSEDEEMDNIAVISGTQRPDKKEGMSSSEVGENPKHDEDGLQHKAVEHETGNVAGMVSSEDEEMDNIAVISGTQRRDKKEGMSSSEVGKNPKHDEDGLQHEAVEHETGNVAGMVSSEDEEMDNIAVISGTQRRDKKEGMSSSEVGENPKHDEIDLQQEAVEHETGNLAGMVSSEDEEMDNIAVISGTQRRDKKKGMSSLATGSAVGKNLKVDEEGVKREAVEYETGHVTSTISSEDEELIKPYLTELFKLACQDKKSHAHKCGGTKRRHKKNGKSCLELRTKGRKITEDHKDAVEHEAGNVAGRVSTMDEELIKAATMEFRKLARQDKKSQAKKRGRKRKAETAGDNSGIRRRCKNVVTRSPTTSSSDDELAGTSKMFYYVANERRAAGKGKCGKGKRGRY